MPFMQGAQPCSWPPEQEQVFCSTTPCLTFRCYRGDSGGPYMAETASVLFEDSKERLIGEADKLREVAVMKGTEVNIEEMNAEGGLGSLIPEVTAGEEIELVIMGGRSGGALEHMLSGSDTAKVIRNSKKTGPCRPDGL